MAVTVTLGDEYRWVVLDIILILAVVYWMMIKVAMARKKYGVQYPTMYSDKSEIFNCYQRVHQNTLEQLPQFVLYLILGSLQHPVVASVAGFLWIVSRIPYALGYYTGDPDKRNYGAFGFLGTLTLMGCTISLALHLFHIL